MRAAFFTRVEEQPRSQGLLRFQDGPQPPLALLRPGKNFAHPIQIILGLHVLYAFTLR